MKQPEAKIRHLPTSLVPEAITRFEAAEVVLGTLVDVDSTRIPWIDYPGNPASNAIKALTTTSVYKGYIGRQVALLFAEGNPEKPVIIGLVKNILDEEPPNVEEEADASNNKEIEDSGELDLSGGQPKEVVIDAERMVFTAAKEIVLKCGKASITLTRAGKVLIRGAYISNRSSGVNRIKGGSVQIN